jgi:hypothetical protein
MSKILGQGETGFGILIEQDAGYVTGVEDPKILTEGFEVNPDEPVYINCILQKWGVKNRNGRIYPKEILVPQVEEYQKQVDSNAAISEADHPDSSVVSLQNISHLIKKMWWGTGKDENVLYGKLEIITSPAYMKNGIVSMIGDKIIEYLKRGIKLGISSRGVGSLKEIKGENIVQGDFELICFDLVASPSTPGAYLFPDKNEMMVASSMGEEQSISGNALHEGNEKLANALNKFLL